MRTVAGALVFIGGPLCGRTRCLGPGQPLGILARVLGTNQRRRSRNGPAARWRRARLQRRAQLGASRVCHTKRAERRDADHDGARAADDGTDAPARRRASPGAENGCRGTEQSEWSSNGRRLFAHAEVTCSDGSARTISGLALITEETSGSTSGASRSATSRSRG